MGPVIRGKLDRLWPYATLLVLFVTLSIASPHFLTARNLGSVTRQTAVINIIALGESGLGTHPALTKAVQWLEAKEVRFRGDWRKKNPHPEGSGWAFEFNNIYYPDTDDTMMVLMLRASASCCQAGESGGSALRS